MPRYVNITTDELEVGLKITAWRKPDGHSGQGGTVTRLAESFLELAAGTNGEFHHTIEFANVHRITVERFLDADECVEHHPPMEVMAASVKEWLPAAAANHVLETLRLWELLPPV